MSAPSSPDSEPKGVKIFSSHDPACDQCRIKKIGCDRELPSCSNCLKAKVECVRSNKGKRPNQTNKLVNDFEHFGNRLGELEKNVNLIHDRLDEFLRDLPSQQHASSEGDSCGRSHKDNLTQSAAVHDVIVSSPVDAQGLISTQSRLNSSSKSAERLKNSSLMSLFEEADEKINTELESLRPVASLRAILAGDGQQEQTPPPMLDAFLAFKTNVYRSLSLSSHTFHADFSNDGAPLILPPKRLLQPIVEPYFRHIASVAPIIGRLPCLQAIDQHYSPATDPGSMEPAWIILFNYMILFCFVGRYMPLDRPSSDIDIMSNAQFEEPFLANIRRSFAIMDKLLVPKLVNIQALAALTLISQKYFSEHVTQYLLNQACFLAKSMGLHRQIDPETGLSAEDIDDKRRVFWNLFTVDKDVSLLLGTPPNLHHYDCDVPYPLRTTYDFLRRLDASLILGKVYIMLYSSAASRASPERRESNIVELMRDLDNLQHAIENVSAKDIDMMHRAWQYLMLEQKHTIHHTRLMVLRRSSQPAKYERRLSEARQCIRTIARVHVARTTVGGFMVLRRPFQWRPFAPFFELLPTIFMYPITSSQLDDLALLRQLVDMLRIVASADSTTSYCGKLLRIASGCVAIAEEFVQQCLHHQNATSPISGQIVAGDVQGKRKGGSGASLDDVRPSKTRTAFAYSNQADVAVETTADSMLTHISSIQHTEPAGFAHMGFDDFGGNGLPDMFPGWPRARSDSFSFLNEGFFWGSEDVFGSEQDMAP